MNIERNIVAKFGGSSVANVEGFIRVADIINEDSRRRVIVLSAPGKDKDNPVKITDLLIICGEASFMNLPFRDTRNVVERRFLGIAGGLGVYIDEDLEELKNGLLVRKESKEFSVAWVASRGEWLSGKILARYLGAKFVDAAEIIKFQNDGTFDQGESYRLISQMLIGSERFVIPGFYGRDRNGRIRIFPRGGSDITGGYLAAAMNAEIYENWTDVDGVKTADPKIVSQTRTIPFLGYEEMAELGFLGAKVLHPSAIEPVWDKGIPVNIRNTFNPGHQGTWIGFLSNKHIRASLNEEKNIPDQIPVSSGVTVRSCI